MTLTELGAQDLRTVIARFRDGLSAHREMINRLNVYPVPDGDTGTNMALTVGSVVDELDCAGPDMAATCRAIAHGSLMGARGNSGVILSQVLRGLADEFSGCDRVDAPRMQKALTAAAGAAYGAVMRPVEGTILTVMRESAEGAAALGGDAPFEAVVEAALDAGKASLRRTPELLPVLADAGVVDAGGAGLLLMYHAFLDVVDGRGMPAPPESAAVGPVIPQPSGTPGGDASALRYEVMYLLEAADSTIPAFKDVWAGLGDSIVVVGGDGIWNCHIHTNDIGAAVEAALDAGRPRSIRVTDLSEEVEEERWVREAASRADGAPPERPAEVPTAVVAVSPAPGIGRIFHSLGVQELVEGGQTMNPSMADLLAAVERAPAGEVIVLPNNSNIIAVAERLDGETTKTVSVVGTTSVTEGFAALLAYDPAATAAANAELMAELADGVVTGEVTRAVRDSTWDGGTIAEGDWLGVDCGGVRAVESSAADAATALLGRLLGPDHEIVTIIEGIDATTGETRRITEWLAAEWPGVGVETHPGGQPHYPYLFGVE